MTINDIPTDRTHRYYCSLCCLPEADPAELILPEQPAVFVFGASTTGYHERCLQYCTAKRKHGLRDPPCYRCHGEIEAMHNPLVILLDMETRFYHTWCEPTLATKRKRED